MTQATLEDYQSSPASGSSCPETDDRIKKHSSTPAVEDESIEVPTVPPIDRNCVWDKSPHRVSGEELTAAVDRISDEIDPLPQVQLFGRVAELPRWIDDSDVPDEGQAGPDRCGHCGARHAIDKPLEQGRELALEGNDGNPAYEPCGPGKYNIESCTCCGCPGCYNRSIYARQNESPKYRCRNPNCGLEFDYPIELPLDPENIRQRLYWSCRACGKPTLAPFTGIPDLMGHH